MMFPGGIGRDAASAEKLKKDASMKAQADFTAFILFGVAIELYQQVEIIRRCDMYQFQLHLDVSISVDGTTY
ncbi:unnamed protein product [Anisakis simplex]|uniref:Uncharacterized protein n=1 Tax=Anisakis simplex TaxID=6269 RepID=A0A0M3KFW3_ANISI|nr:unnamed protein product [Anisakis simplex]